MPRSGRARWSIAVLAVTAGTLLLAACGRTSSSVESTTTFGTGASAQALDRQFVATVKAVSPSVVEVDTSKGLGSGVVLDQRGNIVTNAHVVGSFTRFKVTDSNGRRYSATLVGKFVPDDLAVIHVAGARLPPLPFGNSSRLQVGEIVMTIGNPLGLQSSVAQGIVSALGRTVSEDNGTALADVIQTTAAINPGNSGGALVDLDGRFVGIPTLAAVDPEVQQLAAGIGFAIPSNTVKAIASQLVRYGHVVNSGKAFLGIRLATVLSGRVVVASVVANSPATSAGLVAGDMIAAVDGRAVESIDDIATLLADLHPGAKVTVRVQTPAGVGKTLTVTLGQYPGN